MSKKSDCCQPEHCESRLRASKISPEWRPNVAHGTCECRKISPERRPNVTDIFYERCLAPRERACTLRLATWTKQPRNLWSARARTRSAPFFTCMDQVLRNRVFTCCMLDARAARAIKFWATSKNETAPRHQKVAAPRGHAEFMKSCDFKSEHLCHFIGRIAQEPCCLCAPRGACARF